MPTGDRHALSAEDARILALEEGSVVGHTCKVVTLDGELAAGDLREHLGPRLDAEPLLRVRLADGDPPAWEADPAFDLDRHVRDGGAVAESALGARVGELMAERLPRDRPLWALDVVAVGGARTALVWRIHHALADGMTTMRMARTVLFDAASEPSRATDPAVGPPTRGMAEIERGAAGETTASAGHPDDTHAARRAAGDPAHAGPAPAAAHAPPSRLAPLRATLRVPGALHRELARRSAATVLDTEPGARRAVAFADAGLDEVKRIAHAAPGGATVNDVVLSAVAAGLRDWLDALGAHPRALRVKVPVSLHHPGDDESNRDSFISVDLPLAEHDPVARLRAVAAETRERKRLHDAETIDGFFRDLGHVSSSLERFAEHWAMSPRVFALNVSNVPGPRGPLAVAGVPVASMHSLAEIAHRHALRVAVVSAAGRLCFGFCADADSVGSPERIATGVSAEVAALGDALSS